MWDGQRVYILHLGVKRIGNLSHGRPLASYDDHVPQGTLFAMWDEIDGARTNW